MGGDQLACKLAQLLHGGRVSIDISLRPAIGIERSTQQQLPVVAFHVGIAQVLMNRMLWINLKTSCQLSALTSRSNHLRVCPFAAEQTERVDQQGFARACFSGEDGKTSSQLNARLGNNHEVAQMQTA